MTDKNKYCEVEAKFLLANDRYFTFTRTLYPDEQQIFLIDGEEYPEKVYQNFLVKNNINFITSNFAIWQGEIDKMLLKSPKELTNYIEIVSGSTFFKK
jgi:chromosome segregation ATPase